MRYLITEKQLNVLIKEQNVIKLNLYKDEDNTKLRNLCKPVLVDKKIIDKHIGKVDTEINNYITQVKKKYIKEYPEISNYLLDVEKILSEVKPLISSSIKKTIYTKLGHSNYNDKDDMNTVFKKIYTSIDNALQSNFLKKMAIKTFVTNKNVGLVKQGVSQFFREVKLLMVKLRYWIPRAIISDIREDHKKVAPKCTNVLVVKDTYGDPVTPYNPPHPLMNKDMDYTELDVLLNPYIVSVNKTIDSFV
jgi:hypothetical protein